MKHRPHPALLAGFAAVAFAAASPARSDDAPAPHPQRTVRAEGPLQASPGLRRLGADARQLRFEGESAASEWPVFLTAAQAKARARFRLSYVNAVSVMPEASKLTILINDVAVAETQIAAPTGAGTVNVDIPDGLLEPGYNAVRIAIQQRHRVDCSIGATYELWTQVDPAQTGLLFPDLVDSGIGDLADLPALFPDGNGAVAIRAVVARTADVRGVERALRAVEALAIRGRFVRPSVQVVEQPDDRPGLNVRFATGDDATDPAAGEAVKVSSSARQPNRVDVVIGGASERELDAAVESLRPAAGVLAHEGSAAGLRALRSVDGFRLRPDSTVALRDLGLRSDEFTGRLFRTRFDIAMPPDFFPAEYGNATLRINAGYAPGLDPKSQILVRVNNRDAASLPLGNPGGDIFTKRGITLSLASLRPGFNRIQIDAQVAAPSDTACASVAPEGAGKRFVFLQQSEFALPTVARIAHMPSLSATLMGGFPYAEPGAGARLYVPNPDRPTLGAVATFLARTAVASGAPLETALVYGSPEPGSGSALVIGGLDDLSENVVEAAGLDVGALRQGWPKDVAKLRRGSRDGDAHADGSRPPRDADLVNEWSHTVEAGWFATALATVGRLVGPEGIGLTFWTHPDERFVPPAGARIVVAQHAAPQARGQTWTVVTAPSAEVLASAMGELVSPSIWTQLAGRASAFDPASGSVTVAPARADYFIQTEAFTAGNLRLVAAGWFSSNIGIYVLGLMIVCVVLGLATASVVRKYGTRL